MTTQRGGGFRGGIQAGTTAGSPESVGLESNLRQAAALVAANHPELTWKAGLGADELADRLGVPAGYTAGCLPDGGVWEISAGAQVLLAVEAKRQGRAGNAIERWYKNHAIFSRVGCRIYLTVCAGEGFFDGNSAEKAMNLAVALHEPDRIATGGWWNAPDGTLWMYRYRDLTSAPVEALVELLEAALVAAQTAAADDT